MMSTGQEVPTGWVETKLSEVADMIFGQSPPSSTYNEEGKGWPFFQGKAEFGKVSPTPRVWCTEPARIAQEGDILISIRAPVGPTNVASTECAIGRGLAAIRPYQIPRSFILNYLKFIEPALAGKGTGTTFAAITKDILLNQEIPLPPLAEQRRIVSKIEELFSDLDAGEAALRKVQKLLGTYRQSVLKAAVTGELTRDWRAEHRHRLEPGEALLQRILTARREQWQGRGTYQEPKAPNTTGLPELPEGWVWASVEQVCFVETGATPKKGEVRYYQDGIYAWVTSTAVNQEYIDEPQDYITEAALEETNAKLFPVGTLILAMYGEGKTRGKSSELRIVAATNQACAALLCGHISANSKKYLKAFLLYNYESIRLKSSGGVQPNLNLGIVKQTTIPMPSEKEQDEIVSRLADILSRIDALESWCATELARSGALRQAILKAAFSGKLVPQDSADEPASVLLERIRAERSSDGAAQGRRKAAAQESLW